MVNNCMQIGFGVGVWNSFCILGGISIQWHCHWDHTHFDSKLPGLLRSMYTSMNPFVCWYEALCFSGGTYLSQLPNEICALMVDNCVHNLWHLAMVISLGVVEGWRWSWGFWGVDSYDCGHVSFSIQIFFLKVCTLRCTAISLGL